MTICIVYYRLEDKEECHMRYAIRKENQYYQILENNHLGMTKANQKVFYEIGQIQEVINHLKPSIAEKYIFIAEDPDLDQRINVLNYGKLNSKWYRIMKILCHDGNNIEEQEQDYKRKISFYDREMEDLLHDMANNHSVIQFFRISWRIRKNRINRRISKNDLVFIQSFEKSINSKELESAAIKLKNAEHPIYRYRLQDHEQSTEKGGKIWNLVRNNSKRSDINEVQC